MFKQASSRNNRNKGLKVKHVLQIFLLLAVSIWLLYQVKHSHDKKREYDESNRKIAGKADSSHEILKFGRKDLPQGIEMVTKNDKHVEDEENEDEEEVRKEENVDEERGGGDNVMDEHEQAKDDQEDTCTEDSSDEDNEFSEKDDEQKEENENINQTEEIDSSEHHDENGVDRTQEAREEHYRADDASSAVVRDNQMLGSEVEHEGFYTDNGKHPQNISNTILENHDRTNFTKNADFQQNTSDPNAGEPVVDGKVSTSQTENRYRSNLMAESPYQIAASYSNSTKKFAEVATYLKNETNNVLEKPNSETVELNQTNTSNTTSDVDNLQIISFEQTKSSNATTSVEASQNVSSKQNGLSEASHKIDLQEVEKSNATSAKNETATIDKEASKSNQTVVALESPTVASDQVSTAEKFPTIDSEQIKNSSTTTGVEESVNNTTSVAANENQEVVRSETSDSSSSLVTQEEKDALSGLSTLPQVESEGRNIEETAAE